MRSRTSLRPPPSCLILRGLRLRSSSALSSNIRRPGLAGTFLGLRGDLPGLAGKSAGSLPMTFAKAVFALGFVGVASTLLLPDAASAGTAGAGISNHSSPAMSALLRKNGQSETSSRSDSCASASEIGTGEDLMTAAATSDEGSMRRFRIVGVIVLEPTGDENSLP